MSNEQTEALDVPVTDADRAAAKELMHVVRGYAVGLPNDGHFAIQAFARHRIAATPSPAPSDTLERREAIARALFQRFKERAACRLPEPQPGSYALDQWENLPNSFKRDFYLDADAILALSLPAREVSGERARELADKASEHVRAGDHRMAYFAMCEAFAAALATTPAPREKLEADLVEARTALEDIWSRRGSVVGVPVDSEACAEYAGVLEDVVEHARATLNRLSGEG